MREYWTRPVPDGLLADLMRRCSVIYTHYTSLNPSLRRNKKQLKLELANFAYNNLHPDMPRREIIANRLASVIIYNISKHKPSPTWFIDFVERAGREVWVDLQIEEHQNAKQRSLSDE